jgi:hypothetical protein
LPNGSVVAEWMRPEPLQDFLALWPHTDAEIRILKPAKAEYGKLQ